MEKQKEQTQDFEGLDEMQWRMKEPESYKEICLRAMESCRTELSKDLRKDGNYPTQISSGAIVPLYFPDQTTTIKQTIQTFYDLMFFYFDEEANEKIKTLRDDIGGAYKLFYEKYLKVEYIPFLVERAKKTQMIEIDVQQPAERMRSDVGEKIIEELEYYFVQKYRDMFRELVCLYKRRNELSSRRTAR